MADYRNTQGTSNDNGDGTYLNPVMNTDVADPDVICAPSPDGTEAYYMVSTAMQYAPGCPIMKSTDLVNWETITYLYDTLDYNNDALALRNGSQAYGQGQWATSIKYNPSNKMFYVLTFSYSTFTTQVYTTHDIENGPWKKSEFRLFHDPSLFIDTDNRIYIFYGQNSLYCKELIEEDGYLRVKEDDGDPDNAGVNVVPNMMDFKVPDCIYKDAPMPTEFYIGGEGTHAYKVDGVYYLISITWPGGKIWPDRNDWWRRGEICFRSIPDENGEHHIYGPYEGMMIMNEQADYDGYIGGGGPGQGGMTNVIGGSCRSSESKWYGLIFQDRGALGRCTHLVNVNWKTPGYEGWPMMTVPETGEIPTEFGTPSEKMSLVKSDEFNNGTKYNSATIITPEPKAKMAAAEDEAEAEGEQFNLKYSFNDEQDMQRSITIASEKIKPDEWTKLHGQLLTTGSVKYGRLEVTADNPKLDFYIDDVSVTDAGGQEYAKNRTMEGNAGEVPWCWGPTNVWNSDLNDNVDNAHGVTDFDQYHDSAPSLFISERQNSSAGAMCYLNGGDEIKGTSIYDVSVWVRYNSGQNEQPTPEVTDEGEQLIINGGFETGEAAPFVSRYYGGTTLTVSDVAASGQYGLYVSGRSQTGDGPMYDLTGYIEERREYVSSAKVRYDEGPDERTFNLTLEHVKENGETNWLTLGSVTVKRGEWGEIKGKCMIDPNIGTFRDNVYVETPYNWDPSTDDLIDFYVDDISIIRLPAREWEEVQPGENEPNGSNLDLVWQWNHNPDNRLWSLTEREGYMRLKTGKVVKNIQQARNTLTQRTFGPTCSGWTAMDPSGMKDGDYAGLAAFAARYGFMGITQRDGKKYIVYADTDNTPPDRDAMMEELPNERVIAEFTGDVIYFKTEYTFPGNRTDDTVSFYYSLDGEKWTFVNKMKDLEYSMLHFTGYKFALFNFATQEAGGYADFDYFRIDDKLTGEGGAISAEISSLKDMYCSEGSVLANK